MTLSDSPTVAHAMAEARTLGVDRLDAQLLLAHVVERSRSWLIAHDNAPLSTAQAAAVRAGLARRAAGEPLAYVLGEKEFHGLPFVVDPAVLVPRPDTEILVDWALERLAGRIAPRVIDLGTGSGAIALAVRHRCPAAQVLATDASAAALAVAERNAQRLGLDVRFSLGDWWGAAGDSERFDLVLSNPPYIAGGDPHLAALTHEPQGALTPGGDGLDAIRTLIAGATAHMSQGGELLLEHGYDQADAVRMLLQRHGFTKIETREDLGGRPRCTGALVGA